LAQFVVFEKVDMSYSYENYPAPTGSAGSGPTTQAPPTNSSPQPYQGNGTDPMNQDPSGAPGTGGNGDSKTTLWYSPSKFY
jgi:hypothetical protein